VGAPIDRVIIAVLDGVGAGELPDAAEYGDCGSNTLGNTARAVNGLNLPTMGALGLGCITEIAGVPPADNPLGCYGKMREASPGKDTITGHWEIAGVVLPRAFPTYPQGFPEEIMAEFAQLAGMPALGNCAASGTVIIEKLGKEHVLTGRPIVYTSADSVFQIAMHEAIWPIEKQYALCEAARALLINEHQVGRVICRPFRGDGGDAEVRAVLEAHGYHDASGPFKRTERRKDFPVSSPPTVLDDLITAGKRVHAIGKIYEIYNGRGITSHAHTTNNADHTAALLQSVSSDAGELIFANLEDFDMLYGHRNDAPGMAAALETWDRALSEILSAMRPTDLLLITADHGNDPTTPSTDHSREHPFLLAYGKGLKAGTNLGARATYADIAATVREVFGLPTEGKAGISFLSQIIG
jgi:phosphopentomutase